MQNLSPISKNPILRVPIQEKVLAEGYQMTDFLRESSANLAVLRRDPTVLTFITNHIPDMLECILAPQYADASKRGMKIINLNIPKIIGAICDNDKAIDHYIHESVKNPENLPSISKLSEIIELCLTNYPESIEDTFHSLPVLLDIVGNPMIYSLFEKLINLNNAIFNNFFKTIDITNQIIERITYWHDEPNFETSDYVINLYKLLIKFCSLSTITDDYISPRLICLAANHFDHNLNNVISLQWKLVNVLILLVPATEFSSLFELALETIETDDNFFYPYQTEALHFLTLYSSYSDVFHHINVDKLVSTVSSLFEKFPEHSFVLSEVCNFMITTIDISEYRQSISQHFFPLLAKSFESVNHSNQTSFGKEFVRQIMEMSQADEELKKLIEQQKDPFEVYQAEIISYNKILKHNYGGIGSVPNYVACTLPTVY
ncbi:hypothetical protein GPJ56_006442 [Histomonas meleagridis]|uniref:uncharacterized protein n=1 Tax=Histomonas meleagridis TaxID=135588 RepID=UPI00355A3653|nr:hypothetical protein GPJ56_006442 [Histomonas meleagridis]KAH0796742.1 hypothetical protein GO595_010635 [Histomonas meleagridis]